MKIARTLAAAVGVAVLATTPAAVASFDGPTHPRPPAAGQASADHMVSMRMPTSARIGRAQLKTIRRATARFHNIATAESAGYVLLKDLKGIACIAEPGMGAMGVHYVNPQVIANPAIRATQPEALVYAPERDGTLRLAAMEYIVDKKAWDAGHGGRPQLVRGHGFDLTTAPNRYGLADFYSQHVWAWKRNSAGRLAMWNPTVHCTPRRSVREVRTTWDGITRRGPVRAV